ncbi:expressed unknown protein [Seminavis robusta]|uniref:Exportin-1/Importin-beta-like domain-containing protein n=1 Tax=Seminavis robusta TaxID=568900 RepID=A0A9N8D4T0_9STRA|nr:expressed unknown protein [Seminavis robusta]|eukprot:Sro4_g003880.1 n/a (1024) ;mRNA; f:267574-270645
MEQQVAEAALAMVRSNTDAATRTAASQFLEQWTRTPEAWDIYAKWLRSFRDNHVNHDVNGDAIGMQLLCLTLLQAKIRREVPRGTSPNDSLQAVRNELGSFLGGNRNIINNNGAQQPLQSAIHEQAQLNHSVVTPLCICIAGLAARCGGVQDLISLCRLSNTTQMTNGSSASSSSSPMILPSNALRLLACLPPEVEACAELRSHQVTAELWPYLEPVLDTIRIALAREDTIAPALEALKNWSSICHVSLSHLSTPTCGGTDCLLPLLIQLLSAQQPSRSDVIISASRALTEAILVPSDSCTPARQAAASMLFNAIGSHGFVAAPLAFATRHEWEDTAHALATLVCTLVTEEVDYICTLPAEALLNLLLQIQSHPHTPVTLTALECWLTVQETPASARHNNWKAPLFEKVVQGIVARITLPDSFTSWQDELDVDESEFEELRRMVGDVLISSYYLLRVQFVQMMASYIHSNNVIHWPVVESALFCMVKVAREVCARIKARTGGSSVSADRDATSQQLLQLVEQLCGTPSAAESAARKHPLVLSGVCTFVGAYAQAWNVKCPPEALLQLLAYLRQAMVPSAVVDAAKATRLILVNCSTRLLAGEQQQLLTSLRETLDAVLSTENEEAMATVAEGLTRLLVQIKEESIVRDSLANLIGPLLQRAEAAISVIPIGESGAEASQETHIAVESLARHLHVLQVIIRFCDTGAPISDVIASVWPVLDKAAQRVPQFEFLLDPLLSVHEQLLRTASNFVSPYFEQTIQFVVQVFEAYKHPSSLEYVSGAVETFGATNVDSFRQLLNHVSLILFSYISSGRRPHECPDLIRSYFETLKRYVIYCPSGLLGCEQFTTICKVSLEFLVTCHGEKESTRAILNFLTQLYGWRLSRLDNVATAALEANNGLIDEQLAQHGSGITRACVGGLLGGPTMLWPAYADCLFAVFSVVVTRQAAPPDGQSDSTTVAHQWMFEAQQGSTLPAETYSHVVSILTSLARNGSKSKSKAKMLLTDFAKIAKGEMTTDALVSYSLA